MDEFIKKGNLFELYGALLKTNHREVYEAHVIMDMSFTEIGENMGISRQAAQDLFRRADKKLQEFEETLKLEHKLLHIRGLAECILAESSEDRIQKLAGEIIDGI